MNYYLFINDEDNTVAYTKARSESHAILKGREYTKKHPRDIGSYDYVMMSPFDPSEGEWQHAYGGPIGF
jgi:hypothetical protein